MTRENGPRSDFASFFFTKCYNLTTMDKGDIFIGGIITLIASQPPLQLHLSTLPFEKASGPSSLDGHALRRMQLIQDSVVGPMWILDNQPYLILPHEYIGSFEPTDPEQWIIPSDYPPPVDDEDDQFQPAQQFAEPQFQQQQQGGHKVPPYFPPTFFDQFATMFSTVQRIDTQTQENTRAIQDVASRVGRLEQSFPPISRQVQDIWDYHYCHGHFPPPDPPI